MINIYKAKTHPLSGTNYSEIYPRALLIYKQIVSRSKRRPYIRSRYFKGKKVFLDYFWMHIREKNLRDRVRRLKYYSCGLELIEHSNIKPISKENPNDKREIFYRFTGLTRNGEVFYVQVKEYKKTGHKHLISVFPLE